VVDERGLSSTDIEAARELKVPAEVLFRRLEMSRRFAPRIMEQHGDNHARNMVPVLTAYKNAAPSGMRASLYDEFYETEHHIRLSAHIGHIFPEDKRSHFAEVMPFLVFGPFLGVRSEEQVNAARDQVLQTVADGNTPPDLVINLLQCSDGFDLAEAATRAAELHGLLREFRGHNGPIPMRLNRLLTGDNGKKEENRIVNAMYKRMYGIDVHVDMETFLHRFARNSEDQFMAMVDSAGQQQPLADEIRGEISAGSDGSLNRIFSCVFLATSEERQALLSDTMVFSEIRDQWNQEAMDRVYRSATGELTLADMLRTRDESTEWYTFGIGTDEANSR
jgi:hypothetical protein